MSQLEAVRVPAATRASDARCQLERLTGCSTVHWMDDGPALVVEDRPSRGRCAIVGRNFAAGDVIVAESPLAHVLHYSQWGKRCHGCLQSTWCTGHRERSPPSVAKSAPHARTAHTHLTDLCTGLHPNVDTVFRCGGCQRYLYCSRTCAQADWQRGHTALGGPAGVRPAARSWSRRFVSRRVADASPSWPELAAGAAAVRLALGGIDSTAILTGSCMVESVCRSRNCTCVLAGLATLRLPGLLYRTGLVATYRCGRVPDARFPGDVSLCTCASGCVERVGLTLWRGRNAVYCEIVRSERRYGRRVAAITQPTSRLLADDGGIDGVVNSQRARTQLPAPVHLQTCTAFCEFCVPTDRNLVNAWGTIHIF